VNQPGPEPGLQIACQEVVELLTDYLEGALQPEQVSEIEAHLKLCDGCAVYLDQMRETIRLLGTVPAQSLSDTALTELLSAFHDGRRSDPGP
jgi:predicted anti-sigma-YlaC factor YlaD